MVCCTLRIMLTVHAERPAAASMHLQGISFAGHMQAFNWESHNQKWFQRLTEQADRYASLGFTCVWLPPFTESVSPQGYMPLDLYNLNSRYGSEEDLRR